MWQPSDYILSGEFCDTRSLKEELGRLRRRAGADAAALFVSRAGMFFRSLLLVSHSDPSREGALQAEMVKARLGDDQLDLPMRAGVGRLGEVLGDLVNQEPFFFLAKTFPAESWTQYLPKAPPGAAQGVSEHQAASIVVLSLWPGRGSDVPILDARDLDLLSCMVNARPEVTSHRWLSSVNRIDSHLDDLERTWDFWREVEQEWSMAPKQDGNAPVRTTDSALEACAKLLLDAATELTGSNAGHVYIAKSSGVRLKLVAEKSPIQAATVSPPHEIHIRKKFSVISYCFTRSRPLLINDLDEFRQTHPNISHRPASRDGRFTTYAELTVPIVDINLASQYGMVIGVLNVEKVVGKDTGIYKYEDVMIMRHIALRFCLWRSRFLYLFSTGTLAKLTRRVGITSDDRREGDGASAPLAGPLSRSASLRLPPEVSGARALIGAAVQHAYELTRSAAATVRFLSMDTRSLVLFRKFAYDQSYDEAEFIPLWKQDSVNAWVARTGNECYIKDLTGAGEDQPELTGLFIPQKPAKGIRSECCVPIFVNGRIVGTLNLKSAHLDAYSEERYLIRTFAEQIGLSIALARRATEQEILSLTSTTSLNLHELLKCRDRLGEMATWNPGDGDGELRGAIVDVTRKLEKCIGLAREDPEQREGDLAEILGEVIKEIDRAGMFVRWVRRPGHESTLPGPVASALRLAFREVLFNSYNEVLLVSHGDVRLYYDEAELGGGRFARISIENPVQSGLKKPFEAQLYRLPVRHSETDRPHIGAFIAGSLLRAIGGDLYLSASDKRVLKAVLEVPLGRVTSP